MSNQWKVAPEGATWGEFGPDDENGRINLLTPTVVRRGLAEAREGISITLSRRHMPFGAAGLIGGATLLSDPRSATQNRTVETNRLARQ